MSRARCRNTGCPTVFCPPCALMQKAASTGPKKQDTRCFYDEIHEIILKSLHGGGRIFLCLCPAVPTPFQVPFVVFGIAKRDARISVGGFYRAHSCGQRCRSISHSSFAAKRRLPKSCEENDLMHKSTLRRLISVLAALAMGLFLLTGCGAKTQNRYRSRKMPRPFRCICGAPACTRPMPPMFSPNCRM